MIRKLIKETSGIDVVEFENAVNIWFDPDVDHHEFWNIVDNNNIQCEYMGIDEVNGRHGDCYLFPF